jgi:hypothetical protein
MVLLLYPDKSILSPLSLRLFAGVTSKMMLVYNSRSGEVLPCDFFCVEDPQALCLFHSQMHAPGISAGIFRDSSI